MSKAQAPPDRMAAPRLSAEESEKTARDGVVEDKRERAGEKRHASVSAKRALLSHRVSGRRRRRQTETRERERERARRDTRPCLQSARCSHTVSRRLVASEVSILGGQIRQSEGLVSIDRSEAAALLSTTPRLKPRSSAIDSAPPGGRGDGFVMAPARADARAAEAARRGLATGRARTTRRRERRRERSGKRDARVS